MSEKIDALTLSIAIDTLLGSRAIDNSHNLWKYSKKAREVAADRLISILDKITIIIEKEE